MAGRFSIEAIFKGIDHLTAPIARMESSVGRFTRNAARGLRNLEGTADRFGATMKRVALGVGAVALVGGIAAKNLTDAGADFDQAMANVGAVSLMTRDQIKDLEEQALKLGATTKFSATEVANAQELMGKAGFTNAEILKGLPGVLAAAAAEGAEVAETAGHVSNALKGMGLDASQAGRVADVLALASARTNSSISSLGESLANTAATARQLKVPFEDTVAAVALLQDVGLDASVAGSAVNVMLTKLAKPTDDIAAKMKKFRITFKDAKGDMLPFAKVIENIDKAAKKSGGNLDQVAFLADLVGLRGQKAASNLADLFSSGKLSSLTEELAGAAGTAEKMADIRMDTWRGDLKRAEGAIEGIKIGLFDLKSGALRDVTQGFTEWANANKALIVSGASDFFKSVGENMPQIAKWAERIGILFLAWSGYMLAIKGVALAVAGLRIAFQLLSFANPLTSIVAALALIVAFWPEISTFFKNLWSTVESGAALAWAAITGFFTDAWSTVSSAASIAWNAIKDTVAAVWEWIKTSAPFEIIVGLAILMWEGVKGIFNALAEFIAPIWSTIQSGATIAWNAITEAVGWAWDTIAAYATAAWGVVTMVWGAATGFFSGIWSTVQSGFAIAWDGIKSAAQVVYDAFLAIWNPIVEFFSDLWDTVAAAFIEKFGWILDAIGTAVSFVRGVGRGDDGEGDHDKPGTQTDAGGDYGSSSVPQVVPPTQSLSDEQISRVFNQTTNKVVIEDKSGRAVLKGKRNGNVVLAPHSAPSGGM